ncbi:VOC family protein [soil metagenome]
MAVVLIDHVQLSTPPGGEAAARTFYREVLGLTEVAKPEARRVRGGIWFAEGLQVGLGLGLEPGMKPLVNVHAALVVEGLEALDALDALDARLRAASCEVLPATDQPGVRRFHTRHPFGNRIELVAEPSEDRERGG